MAVGLLHYLNSMKSDDLVSSEMIYLLDVPIRIRLRFGASPPRVR